MHLTIQPYTVFRDDDVEAFRTINALFQTREATTARVQGMAQRYRLSNNAVEPFGAPFFWLGPKEASAPPSWYHHKHAGHNATLQQMAEGFQEAWMHATFDPELRYVASPRAWLFAFPDLVVLQADAILQEIKRASNARNHRNVEHSTWARAAYATLRFSQPTSSHATMRIAHAVPRAMDAIATLRSERIGAARAAGYHLGAFTHQDLQDTVLV